MAFVRWRGNSATLLTTVYDSGKSKQVQLAALGCGYSVSTRVRESVTERFPNIPVDWEAVNKAMANGPPDSPLQSRAQMTYLEVEQRLREWAQTAPYPSEKHDLVMAAHALSNMRVRAGQMIDEQGAV